MAASGKAIGAALRRHGAAEKHPQSVTSAQQAGLASHTPGSAASLKGQSNQLAGQSRDLPGGADSLPSTLPNPVVAIEAAQGGLLVHVTPTRDGHDASQFFPDSPEGRHVAVRYAAELSHATKLAVSDRTTGGHHARGL